MSATMEATENPPLTDLDKLVTKFHESKNAFQKRLILRGINAKWKELSGDRPKLVLTLSKSGKLVAKKTFTKQLNGHIGATERHGDVKAGDLIAHIKDSNITPERMPRYRDALDKLTQAQRNLFADDIMRTGDKAINNWKTIVDADEAEFQKDLEARNKEDAKLQEKINKEQRDKPTLTQEAGQLLTKVGVKAIKKTAQVLGIDDPVDVVNALPNVRMEDVDHVINMLPLGGKEKVLAKTAVKMGSAIKGNLNLNRGGVLDMLERQPLNQHRIKNRSKGKGSLSLMWDIINDPVNRALLHVAGPLLIQSAYDYVRNNWGKKYKPKPLSQERIARESAKLDTERFGTRGADSAPSLAGDQQRVQPESRHISDGGPQVHAVKQHVYKTPRGKPQVVDVVMDKDMSTTGVDIDPTPLPPPPPDKKQTIQTDTQTLIDQTPFDRDIRIEALKKQLQELKLNQISHEIEEQSFTKKRKFRPEIREFNPERLNFYVSKEHEELERAEVREFKYIPEGSGVSTHETEMGLNPIHNDNKLHDEIRYRGVISLMRDYEPPGYKFVLQREGSIPKPMKPVNPRVAERYDNNMKNSIRPAEPFRQRQYRELTDNVKGFGKEPVAMLNPIDEDGGIGSNQNLRNYIHSVGYRNIYK